MDDVSLPKSDLVTLELDLLFPIGGLEPQRAFSPVGAFNWGDSTLHGFDLSLV